jgi:DHA3 family macrolide efflux protein-like MFS transporter
MTSQATALSFRDVLQIRTVKRLWIAQIVSVFGDFLAVFAVIAQVTFRYHGTPTQVGIVVVAFLAPLAVISPLAGVYVDKWNVRWTMIGSDLIRGVLILGLVFIHDLNTIYVVFFLQASVSAFFIPAQSVAVRTITPAAGLMTVNALMSQAVQVCQIVAPSVAGGLVEVIGGNACFLFDSASFFFSAAMVYTLTIQRHAAPPSGAGVSAIMASMRAGFRFIFTHSTVSFVILSMTAGMFAVRCFGALLSVYVRDVLFLKSAAYGFLNTLIGVGMITGSQLITRFARHIPKQNLVVYGLAGMGGAVLFTAIFGRVVTTGGGMLGLGFGAAFIMITSQTVLQQETPKEMLGRVTSALMSLLAISQVIAMFVAGPFAERAGIRNLYFGSAAMLMVIALIGHSKLRGIAAASAAAAAAQEG